MNSIKKNRIESENYFLNSCLVNKSYFRKAFATILNRYGFHIIYIVIYIINERGLILTQKRDVTFQFRKINGDEIKNKKYTNSFYQLSPVKLEENFK